MTSFSIDMSSPLPSGFTRGLGGPNSGGHASGQHWYIQYGMDFAASVGTEVHAAFDAHITKFAPHIKSSDTDKVYGAQLFMRSPNDQMGAFYTHITSVPARIRVGSTISRGDLLGKVYVVRGGASHLHWALVEIIGGAPTGRYRGVNLYKEFMSISPGSSSRSVTFNQDGTPPIFA